MTSIIVIAIGVVVIILAGLVYAFRNSCPQGGDHKWEQVAIVHGEQPMHHRVLWHHEYFDADTYIKLLRCEKCKEEHAYQWVGVKDSEFNYDKEVNLTWAKRILEKGGTFKK